MNVVSILSKLFASRVPRIGADEAAKRVADGALLIDVRNPLEFARKHIEGAVNVPLSSLPGGLPVAASSVVFYCASGRRSRMACARIGDTVPCFNLGPMSAWSSKSE